MLKVEIQGDDTFQIDASIVVRDIGLEPFEVQRLMVRLRTGAGNGQPFFPCPLPHGMGSHGLRRGCRFHR
jgi:hypothetical protein